MSADPYVYPGTDVLVNLYDERDPAALADREVQASAIAMLGMRRRPVAGRFDGDHLRRIHEGLFKDVYPFAGKDRTISLSKAEIALGGASVDYAQPGDVAARLDAHTAALATFRWNEARPNASARGFAQAMADIWKDHPFREGNTRATMVFMDQFARERGFELDPTAFARYPSETRDAFARASVGDVGGLARIVADARRSQVERTHPVLGRMTSETAEVLRLLDGPRVEAARRGEVVSGSVLSTSYQAVLVIGRSGVRAVDASNFDAPPENNRRVSLTVEHELEAPEGVRRQAAPPAAERPRPAPPAAARRSAGVGR